MSKTSEVIDLRKQLKELGHRDCHSCYVCYDDWAFERRRCFDRQLSELQIRLLVGVSDLVTSDREANSSLSNPQSSPQSPNHSEGNEG